MRKIGFSICIPRLGAIHFGVSNGIVASRFCKYGWYAHYGKRRRSVCRSEKNITGEWGHYDRRRNRIGYSQHVWFLKLQHFDKNETPIGSTYGRWIFPVHILFWNFPLLR